MKYWIFTVRNIENNQIIRKGIEVYRFGMEKKFWKIRKRLSDGKRTANVSYLKKEDRVVFYWVGKEERAVVFLGTCTLDSGFVELSLSKFQETINDASSDWYQGVFLKNIEQWQKPLSGN